MTEPRAKITETIPQLYSWGPDDPSLKGICADINYDDIKLAIQISLDPPVISHPSQYEGSAQLLKELGEALSATAKNDPLKILPATVVYGGDNEAIIEFPSDPAAPNQSGRHEVSAQELGKALSKIAAKPYEILFPPFSA